MEPTFMDFLAGNVSVFRMGDVIFSSEVAPSGGVLWHVSNFDTGNEVRSIWISNKSKGIPKTTGGKKPYLMVMIDDIDELVNGECTEGDINEQMGYLCCLGKYIHWNTGQLVNKRTKKQLKYNDLLKLFKCGNKKLNRLLNQMKSNEILFSTDKGYFVSRKYIKKGKKGGGY